MLLPYPEFIKNYILSYWAPGQSFLEIGSGTSYMRSFIKEDYIGTDITKVDYIDGIERNVDFVSDAHLIPLHDNSFDIIFLKSTFYMMQDLDKALKEFWRVLKPGGRILIFDYNYKTQFKLRQRPTSTYSYSMLSQFGLYRLIKSAGFLQVSLLNNHFPASSGIKRYYNLIKSELLHEWASITGVKP